MTNPTPNHTDKAHPAAKAGRKLTARQERFVAEYLLQPNATQAAAKAGYSAKTADRIGPELLGKTCVAQAIAAAQAKRAERAEINADRVLAEVARLAFADVRALFDDDGRLRPIHQLTAEAAAAISSFEVVTRRTPGGEAADIEHVARVRTFDKGSALVLLAKHLGLAPDRLQALGRDGKPVDPVAPVLNISIAPSVPTSVIERVAPAKAPKS
jgi:phage terminase small subunit